MLFFNVRLFSSRLLLLNNKGKINFVIPLNETNGHLATNIACFKKRGSDLGYSEFYESVDTIILGKRTFKWTMRQDTEVYPHK